jgi:tape measure domain-containing protein
VIFVPGITQTLGLKDQMSPVLKSITRSMQDTISVMKQMNLASDRAISPQNFTAIEKSIAGANSQLDKMDSNLTPMGPKVKTIGSGFSAWTNAVLLVNNALQLTRTLFNQIQKVGDMTSDMTNANSRLALVNDGLQTQDELQKMIYESAQRSNSSYKETIQSVARIGPSLMQAGATTQGVVGFAELLNKSLVLSGTSGETLKAVLRQVSQAISSGVLRGDELTTVLEGAPDLVQRMGEYLGGDTGKIRELASEGKLTADILIKSLTTAADDINADFATFPKTWKSIWQNIENFFTVNFQPILTTITTFLNSPMFTSFVRRIEGGISQMITYIQQAITWFGELWNDPDVQNFVTGVQTAFNITFNSVKMAVQKIGEILKTDAFQEFGNTAADAAILVAASFMWMEQQFSKVVSWMAESWETFKPLLLGIAGILMVVQLAIWIYNAAAMAYNVVVAIQAVVTWLFAGSIMAIVVLVAISIIAIVALIAWFVKLYQTNVTFRRWILEMKNACANFWDSLKIGFAKLWNGILNGVGAFKTGFMTMLEGLVNGGIGIINGFFDVLNKIPGVSIEAIGYVTWSAETAAEEQALTDARAQEISDMESEATQKRLDREAKAAQELADMEAEQNIKDPETNDKGTFRTIIDDLKAQFAPENGAGTGDGGAGSEGEGKPEDEYKFEDIMGGMDGFASPVSNTEKNTAKAAKSLNNMETDVEYLYEIAERQATMQVTTEAPIVNFVNNTPLDSNVNIDSVIKRLETYVADAMVNGISGVAYA